VQEAQDLQNKLVITSVPTLAVSGKYVVNMDVGRKASLDIVDQLIALEKNEDLADRAAGELDP
jgi:hypothetical protein